MIYDLGAMAYDKGIRADVAIKVRGPTRELERDLERLMRPVIDHWAENLPTAGVAPVRDSLQDDVEATFAKGFATVTAAIAALWRWVEGMDRYQRAQWIASVLSATGLEVAGMAPTLTRSRELRDAVQWAANLITDLNDDMRKRVTATLLDASAKRLSAADTALALRNQVGLTRRRAKLIAFDQTQKIAAKMNELQQRAAGIEEYVWQHSFRRNPRKHHVARQGLRFRWNKPPKDGHPGHAINCRCTASALLRSRTRREVYLR